MRLANWARYGAMAALMAAEFLTVVAAGAGSDESRSANGRDDTAGRPFTLTDHDGNRVTDKDFRGRYLLVSFGYTFCPDVCPTTLQHVAEAMELLGEDARRVTPLFITLDPARDTAPVLKDYVTTFHPSIVGLTGSEAETKAVAGRYNAVSFITARIAEDEYFIAHTALKSLIGPDGRHIGDFDYDMPPERIARTIGAIIARDREAPGG